MKKNPIQHTSRPLGVLFFSASVLVLSPALHAANGTWDVDADGNWNNEANWLGGTIPDIADGADSTAFFTKELTTDRIVTLGADRTIGNITFTDGTTSTNNLTISGGNLLTLDVTTGAPAINITQADRTLTIASQVTGLDGLAKIGAGTLSLTSAPSS